MKNLLPALREVFASAGSRILGVLSFSVFLVVYLMTLPATFTGGRMGLQALSFVTPQLIGWSVLLSVLLGMLVPMTVYLLKRGYKARGGVGGTTSGLAISLVTPLLCCSPVLPIAFSFLAGWIPLLAGGAGGVFQGFLATHEWLFFALSALILLGALFWNAREVVKGSCCEVGS
ncbi:MAG: hypothetical protein ACYCS1_09655 [Gammaproteobacteria bacterium]